MALLAAATVAVFWPVSRHEFVNYDDPAYVTHNLIVQEGLTWPGLKWAFGQLHGEATYWHPLTWLSHMVDCRLYGLRPAGHHVSSLVLHLLNTILLFALLRRMTNRVWNAECGMGNAVPASKAGTEDSSRFTFHVSCPPAWPSLLAAGLFALHPLQVDSVAWIAERKNLLSLFFGLLCLSAYARYAESRITNEGARAGNIQHPMFRGGAWYLVALALFALGLMSKPMLVPLPFVMLLLDYWPLGRLRSLESRVLSLESTGRSPQPSASVRPSTQHATRNTQHASRIAFYAWLRLLAEKIPFLALSAGSSLVTIRGHESLGALVSAEELPVANRVANALVAYVIYLRKVVWPVDLSVFYLHPGRWPKLAVVGSAAILLAITALSVWQARRRPYLIVGWLWFLGMLVPTIGLVQAHVQALADRFIYMPIIGLLVMAAWGAADVTESWPARRAARGGLAALVLATCGILSTLQLRYWQDSLSLLQHAVQVEGRNFIARVMLGNAFFERGQLEPARREYEAATRLRPDYAEAWDHAGMVLTQEGKPADAILFLRKAVELAPEWPDPRRRLALALLRDGRKEEARAAYQQLVRLMPATAEGYRDLADMLNEGQQFAEAIHYYRETLRLAPDFPPVLNNLALLLATCEQRELRDGPEAVRLAEHACQLTQRRDANLLGTLAVAYAQAGQFSAAVKTTAEAQAVAKASGANYLLPLQAEMLQKFRAGKPFR
jgi:tetratricopeptide (TPR) repeat protein